jgi:hypothetical protein
MNTNTEEWGNIELPGLSDEELFSKDWLKSGRSLDYYSDPKNRSRRAEIARQVRESEEWKQRHKAGVSTDTYRAFRSQQNKDRWNDLEWREWYLNNHNRPDIKEKMSQRAKEREQDLEFKKRKAEALAPTYIDPARNKKISEKVKAHYKNNPSAKLEISKRAKEIAANRTQEEVQAIMKKRANNGTWKENVKKGGRKKAKPMMCDGMPFPGVTDAAKYFDVDPGTIGYRRTKFPDRYYYISQEEYILLTGKDI